MYNPNQPRDPGGTITCGQWSDGGGSGAADNALADAVPSGVVKQGALTDQQRVIAKDYKEGGYRPLNQYLRKPSEVRESLAVELEKEARTLDAAINKSTLTADVTVYRGIQHHTLATQAERLVGRE